MSQEDHEFCRHHPLARIECRMCPPFRGREDPPLPADSISLEFMWPPPGGGPRKLIRVFQLFASVDESNSPCMFSFGAVLGHACKSWL